jgi:hypothetical protein
MTVNQLGTRRVTIPDGTAYELVSFDLPQAADRAGLHRVTTSAFDRENQFLFEVVAPPCAQNEISATQARTEQHAEDRLGSHVWSQEESDRLEPSTPAGA